MNVPTYPPANTLAIPEKLVIAGITSLIKVSKLNTPASFVAFPNTISYRRNKYYGKNDP